MIEITIPAVGESITTAFLAQWHKKSGEAVAKGDLILTIETDKVSTELTADSDGVLEVIVAEGEEVPIGALVARIDPAGSASVESPKAEAATEAVVPAPVESSPPPAAPAAATANPAAAPASVSAAVTPNLSLVPTALDAAVAAEESAPDSSVPPDDGRVTRTKLSPLRRKIATHLVNAQQTAAILTTFNECDMSAVMKLRKSVQESFVAKHGVKLGFMSFFIKAVVEALRDVPQVNSRLEDGYMLQNHFYDIGVAVGTEKGLVVPVVRDCDKKSFAEIEKDIIDYATKARDGKITLEDLSGGVFTISNGGVYGSLLSTPILNPPQSGILGMHTIQQRPVAIDGKVEIRPMMYLALSYDHRIVDGKEAVSFLIRIKDCLEEPTRLLIGA
ncbi:MAG: 2-oxoglutarate dehydrogenase E2 component (dihydrolipoamide succinyltransferase) [Verrucomicrobiales bacterium]|jgi:2-oxoglutarate dehydrogenase E2 component (dihydrolipoamide succinyltransferase)